MNLSQNELARRDGDRLVVRSAPLRVRWRIDELVTSDSHHLACDFSCTVRLLDKDADRRMLDEALLAGRAALAIGDLVEHFQPSLSAAAARVSSQHAAAEWLDRDRPAMLDALRAAATTVAFSCGVEVLPPFQLDVHSPSLRRQILESTQRQLAEQRAAGQAAHFQHAMQLLREFETLRQASPHLRFGELLRHISPTDQGPLMSALTHAHARQDSASNLYAVAGPYLLKIDARESAGGAEAQRIELPAALGPLRSVQGALIDDMPHLLIGARGGVIATPAGRFDAAVLLCDPQTTSPLGFSRAVHWNSGVWACHGEAGLVGWTLAEPSSPHQTFRPAQIAQAIGVEPDSPPPGPRHLQAIDDARLIFAFGEHLVVFDRNGQFSALAAGPHGAVAAIVPAGDELVIAHENGQISRRRRDTLEIVDHDVRKTQRIVAAAALPWLADEVRLLIAEDRGSVSAVGLNDTLITQYLGGSTGARMLAATAAHVAAVSMDRQRLTLWNSWDGAKPCAELHIAAMTKHRIADIEAC